MQINTSQDIYLPSLFTFDFFIPVQFASRPFDLFCVLINSKLTCPEFFTTSDLLGQQPSCTILISDRFIVYNYGPIFWVLYLFSSGTSKIICCIKIVIILQKKEVHGVLCERADGRKLSGLNLNSNSLKVGLAVLFLFSTRVYRRLQAATLEKL